MKKKENRAHLEKDWPAGLLLVRPRAWPAWPWAACIAAVLLVPRRPETHACSTCLGLLAERAPPGLGCSPKRRWAASEAGRVHELARSHDSA